MYNGGSLPGHEAVVALHNVLVVVEELPVEAAVEAGEDMACAGLAVAANAAHELLEGPLVGQRRCDEEADAVLRVEVEAAGVLELDQVDGTSLEVAVVGVLEGPIGGQACVPGQILPLIANGRGVADVHQAGVLVLGPLVACEELLGGDWQQVGYPAVDWLDAAVGEPVAEPDQELLLHGDFTLDGGGGEAKYAPASPVGLVEDIVVEEEVVGLV